VGSQQLQLSGVSAAGGELQQGQHEADADKWCALCRMTDFEKISALSSLPHWAHSSNTIRSNSSHPALENFQAQDDKDSYAETKPDLDDEQELSALAQRQPSAFHAAMSREVCVVIFFSCLKLMSTSIEAILARTSAPNNGSSGRG